MLLKEINPFDRDSNVEFFKDGHYYVVTRNGLIERANTSVTSLSKVYFTQFDSENVVKCRYEAWKANKNSKYYALIHSVLKEGGTDSDCMNRICTLWTEIGKAASKAGTKMHEKAEIICNGISLKEEDNETKLLKKWLSDFQPEMQWEPYRTEWTLWWEEPRIDNRILVAGTLDLLLKSKKTNAYSLVDFKRMDTTPKFEGGPKNLIGHCEDSRFHPGYARSPLSDVEDSKFGAYCVQLNALSKILRERYHIDVKQNMYLLQIHPSMEQAHCVRVPMYKQSIDSLFVIESERLVIE
jgi:hypothetical protein